MTSGLFWRLEKTRGQSARPTVALVLMALSASAQTLNPPYLCEMHVAMGMKEQAIAVQQTLQKIDSAKAKELGEHIQLTFSDKDDPENLYLYA